jgi:glucose-6-phosphate 1-dehydrogenase
LKPPAFLAPFDLVIFGGSGDLARRKLLPALFQRFRAGQLPAGSRVIGAARAPHARGSYREWVRTQLAAQAAGDAALLEAFLEVIDFVALDLATSDGWSSLAALLRQHTARVQVFYLAVDSTLVAAACEQLRAAALNGPDSRVVIEKPIGHDLASARAISALLAQGFEERQIFRIDHYLGKETVQNLLALRFGNGLFEPLWNAAHIDHVQITAAERLGLESRHHYYDAAGALRDMCRTICCSCCASWPWSRRRWMPTRCAMRSSRCCAA